MGLSDALDHITPAPTREVDIEQNDVGPPLLDQLDGRTDLRCLANDLDVGGQAMTDADPEQVVVVNDEDPDWLTRLDSVARSIWHLQANLGSLSGSGPNLRSSSDLGRPGGRWNHANPAGRQATASGSKPTPRSRTKSLSAFSSAST